MSRVFYVWAVRNLKKKKRKTMTQSLPTHKEAWGPAEKMTSKQAITALNRTPGTQNVLNRCRINGLWQGLWGTQRVQWEPRGEDQRVWQGRGEAAANITMGSAHKVFCLHTWYTAVRIFQVQVSVYFLWYCIFQCLLTCLFFLSANACTDEVDIWSFMS